MFSLSENNISFLKYLQLHFNLQLYLLFHLHVHLNILIGYAIPPNFL